MIWLFISTDHSLSNIGYHLPGLCSYSSHFIQGLMMSSLFSFPLAERRGLHYEHPNAWSPCELLSGYCFTGPKRCGAAGEARFRTRCGVFAHGHEGEPLAAHRYSCQQEKGKKGTIQHVKWTHTCRDRLNFRGNWKFCFIVDFRTMTDTMTCNVKVDTWGGVHWENYHKALCRHF